MPPSATNPYWLQVLAADRERVEELLEEGSTESLERCLAMLQANQGRQQQQQHPGEGIPGQQEAVAVCRALLAAARRDWRAVLELPPEAGGRGEFASGTSGIGGRGNTVAAIRSQFRRLSRLVHPDKSLWPRSALAFQALQRAAEELVQTHGAGGASPPRDNGSGSSSSGGCSCRGENWWEDWTPFGRREDGGGEEVGERAADEEELAEMDLPRLRAAVGERQRAVMSKLHGSAEGPQLDLPSLQQRLRRARSALAARLSEPQAEPCHPFAGGGGFFAPGGFDL
eukprot:CAMPEP_0117685070 /NCGR_PEP_ID=MMETSP0804-20121206/21519_1 /TAXON_ID=1074897 /ORGANISM="Tetraselmis astigmatica, Strain CCMP880" /LENGTH=283 /DNA_ID=CAMNT_0005496269 /DNA_START=121 /DNA_END=972 /DNA_ORIENTATION=-